MMEGEQGILLKVNPPLRPPPMPALMMRRLLEGDIDWIETDHAPHTLADKTTRHASGMPGIPFYPRFVRMLSARGISGQKIEELTHGAICRAFGVTIVPGGRAPETDLAGEYEFDPFRTVEKSLP
jgi:dihydroorotase